MTADELAAFLEEEQHVDCPSTLDVHAIIDACEPSQALRYKRQLSVLG